ncbi:MAG: HD domain-containing protein [Firmicutes bacterium]|nr:HD domain-containing protein [Bacillota bacterium]
MTCGRREEGHIHRKRTYIKDLQPGARVAGSFVLKRKRLDSFVSKEGSFLNCQLGDRTGEISAVLWDGGPQVYSQVEEGAPVWVEGQVGVYRGSPQIVLDTLRQAQAGEYDPGDFLPTGDADPDKIFQEIEDVVESIGNPHLQRLLRHILGDEQVAAAFRQAPGAKGMHHAYLGGLIEHTWNVVRICDQMARIYPLDRDLLLTGAILHDIGKLHEYVWDVVIDISDEGRLLGHIVMADEMLCRVIDDLEGFPAELKLRLRHLLISHHGQYEWGSPRRPKMPEACVLHQADLMDAEVFKFVAAAKQSGSKGWSSYDRALNRMLYLGREDG